MRIYQVFPNGKRKALTMSSDDGVYADKRLVNIFNAHGIKGTFNLNYGLMGNGRSMELEEAAELYKGHEIATHTYTHPTIARCPVHQIYHEILEDKKGWESVTGSPVRGHAYPNGSYSEEVKRIFKDAGIAYARTVKETQDFGLPADWMEWEATCHHNHNLMQLAERFAECNNGHYIRLMYVWGHSYEFDNDDNWELIEQFCEYISGREDIWYATNIEIKDYMDAWERLQFASDGSFVHNPSALDVWICVGNDMHSIRVPGGTTISLTE